MAGKGKEAAAYMRMALSLAARGKGMTHPNPMVGAVVVKGGRVIGRGYHRGPHTPHAEAVALAQAGSEAAGGDLYVTLEPCNHQGRTPPCTDAILHAGIRRVFIAAPDPNPHVAGGGAERLRGEGVTVESGVLREESERLNAAYLKLVTTGLPLVTLKVAATADGRAATRDGASRWITGEEARKLVHVMRRESDAVMVGRGTVQADDPELTVRLVPLRGARPPLRVVVDSRLSMDLGCRLAQGGEPGVIVATGERNDREKARILRARGVELLELPCDGAGRVDLKELLLALGARGVAQLLVEGGPTLAGSLLRQGLVDRLALFLSGKVFGDAEARSWVEGCVVRDPSRAMRLRWERTRRVGQDLLLEAIQDREVACDPDMPVAQEVEKEGARTCSPA
ncbi:MAG: bifunctional diaminohydroxyphosphoribosylaminopyrimidine deaminase/5-amino-6-(5-phosphoribosylamino)uracil reductase RibD [Actinobacteria bacterium]|nr:bifunctional diaminohydroxyphosphoribosylaminopyrimidine deaminase/5-amino-6-(5-phosphoribosylamino)uracil reductase RibD [Actinomycetota bacterium]